MTPSTTPLRLLARWPSRLLPLGLLVIAAHANAGWTLAQADAPVTVVHAASQYQTGGAQRLALNDIVETPPAGGVQIQDDSGDIILLGHDTRAMLVRDGQIALLKGWVKARHACSAPNCAAAVIETASAQIDLGEKTAIVIAVAPPDYQGADGLFCESGTASIVVMGNSRSKPTPIQLTAQQFAAHTASNTTFGAVTRPDPGFIAAMPVNFRDNVRALPISQPAQDVTAQHMQPVSYDDVSDWLNSGLAVRTQAATSFATRFQSRLSDASFRREITQHLRTLPEWRPLIFPAPRSSASAGPYTYHLTINRP
jgi:hypothetical protein